MPHCEAPPLSLRAAVPPSRGGGTSPSGQLLPAESGKIYEEEAGPKLLGQSGHDAFTEPGSSAVTCFGALAPWRLVAGLAHPSSTVTWLV